MGSLENITKSLAGLSITPSATVEHDPASSPAAWREALQGKPSVPASFELLKTIVYKPKTAKTATPVPLVVIAREGTDVITGPLGKKLTLKDLRLASDDLLSEFFVLDKNSRKSHLNLIHSILKKSCGLVTPLALNEQIFPKVTVALDSTIQAATTPLAVRALSTSSTIFLSGQDIFSYLKKLETANATIKEVDFEALKSEMAQAPPPAPAAATSKAAAPSGKIEGAVQIAIGIRKDVDFAGWYTNVSQIPINLADAMRQVAQLTPLCLSGVDQGGYA